MNIKQAEALSGVSKRNIRFYEQEGLIFPTRNKDNDYREYTDADIEVLKKIRILRMIDMPLNQIKDILSGQISLADATNAQKERLEEKARELSSAIHFCHELSTLDIGCMDADAVLQRMEQPDRAETLFKDWVHDYREISRAEHNKVFTFTPDTPVTTPAEFSFALRQYAGKNDLDLVITRESMYPEFSVDGIEYTASRAYTVQYRVPVAVIRCTAKHPEDFETDAEPTRKTILKLLHHYWFLIPVTLGILFLCRGFLTNWEGWVLLISFLLIGGVSIFRFNYFFYNHDGKPEKK